MREQFWNAIHDSLAYWSHWVYRNKIAKPETLSESVTYGYCISYMVGKTAAVSLDLSTSKDGGTLGNSLSQATCNREDSNKTLYRQNKDGSYTLLKGFDKWRS